jgi:hypothetical protein
VFDFLYRSSKEWECAEERYDQSITIKKKLLQENYYFRDEPIESPSPTPAASRTIDSDMDEKEVKTNNIENKMNNVIGLNEIINIIIQSGLVNSLFDMRRLPSSDLLTSSVDEKNFISIQSSLHSRFNSFKDIFDMLMKVVSISRGELSIDLSKVLIVYIVVLLTFFNNFLLVLISPLFFFLYFFF